MPINFSLSKKLLAYSAIAPAILCLSKSSNAQVIYHNFNPDEQLSGFSQFDLDNDGIYDLAFNNQHLSTLVVSNSQNYYKVSCTASIRASSYNSLAGNGSGLAQLNSGDVVDQNLQWAESATFLLGYLYRNDLDSIYNVGGNWNAASDKFFAFRLKNGAATFYGWMRMSVDGNGCGLTLNDFAVNTTPDEFIAAGDTGLATVVPLAQAGSNPEIYTNHSSLFINVPGAIQTPRSFIIIDLLGRKRCEVNSYDRLTAIPLNSLSAGEYLLVISDDQQSKTYRFIKD